MPDSASPPTSVNAAGALTVVGGGVDGNVPSLLAVTLSTKENEPPLLTGRFGELANHDCQRLIFSVVAPIVSVVVHKFADEVGAGCCGVGDANPSYQTPRGATSTPVNALSFVRPANEAFFLPFPLPL